MTVSVPPANPISPGSLIAGIDTHKDTHHVAVVDHLGRPIEDHQFSTTPTGYKQIVAFLRSQGTIDQIGVEGTGSYGSGIARMLTSERFTVAEVVRPNRQARRINGKSDPLDARQAALAVLAGSGTTPKTGDGPVETLRVSYSPSAAPP